MNRIVIIEGILLLVIGLLSMAEGLRLSIYKDPHVLYDLLGPGLYVILLGIGLLTTGVVYFIVNYRRFLIIEKVAVSKEMRIRMFSTVIVLVIYLFLISIVGYLVATIVFFSLEFRVIGIKSWPLIFILSMVLSAVYYFVFIQYCSMIFPRGIFFN